MATTGRSSCAVVVRPALTPITIFTENKNPGTKRPNRAVYETVFPWFRIEVTIRDAEFKVKDVAAGHTQGGRWSGRTRPML